MLPQSCKNPPAVSADKSAKKSTRTGSVHYAHNNNDNIGKEQTSAAIVQPQSDLIGNSEPDHSCMATPADPAKPSARQSVKEGHEDGSGSRKRREPGKMKSKTKGSGRAHPVKRAEDTYVRQLLNQRDSQQGSTPLRLEYCFFNAAIQPPITAQSLSELDITQIISNQRLRHDVNFDRELHFRPNYDGVKGQQKMKSADEYWTALAAELQLYNMLFGALETLELPEGTDIKRLVRSALRRIPPFFQAAREILKSLVPEADQALVEERLDIPLFMQEIQKGVFDLANLVTWLGNLVKSHCAPMRDHWVDDMVKRVREGIEAGDSMMVISGLRDFLGILEAMKLDVANHQIRYLRNLLIEDTVKFETRQHLPKVEQYPLKYEQAKEWYNSPLPLVSDPEASTESFSLRQNAFNLFILRIVQTLLSMSSSDTFPHTFYLDADRLKAAKNELHHHVLTNICLDAFQKNLRIYTKGRSIDVSVVSSSFSESLADIVGSKLDPQKEWQSALENVAVEMVRQLLAAKGSSKFFDPDMYAKVLSVLRHSLDPSSKTVSTEVRRMTNTLVKQVRTVTEQHSNEQSYLLFESLVPLSQSSYLRRPSLLPNCAPARHSAEAYQDLVRRIAHIALLHWKIWKDLVYRPDESLSLAADQEQHEMALAHKETSDAGQDESEALGEVLSNTPVTGGPSKGSSRSVHGKFQRPLPIHPPKPKPG